MENTLTLSQTSKVWVYMADRELSTAESTQIQNVANQFVEQWAAHGKDLLAQAKVSFNRFIILIVDESQASAGGCSIDRSIHFIKEIGAQLNVDFLNRLLMAYRDANGNIQTIHQSKISELFESNKITNDTVVFNNMVKTKAALDDAWEVALKDSFYRRLV